MPAGGQDRGHLPGIQGARRPAGHDELDRPGRDRPALGHMVQERLIGPAADPAPGDQFPGHAHAAAGVVVIEAEHPGKVTVHRCRRPPPGARLQHDHVLRRGPQPGHEPGHILHAGLGPADTGLAQELKPQPQAHRVCPHRVRRALQRAQVGQVPLGRGHDSTIIAEHGPRLDVGDGHHNTLNKHTCSPSWLGSHQKGNRCLTIAARRYITDSLDTTSDNVSTTQLERHVSYVVDTPKRTADNGGSTRALPLAGRYRR